MRKKKDNRTLDRKMQKKCSLMYWNLLDMLKTREYGIAHIYASEFFETAHCDQYRDFSEERKGFKRYAAKFLDGNALDRVLKAQQTQNDIDVMERTVTHYYVSHQQRLRSALTWPQWGRYYFNYARIMFYGKRC